MELFYIIGAAVVIGGGIFVLHKSDIRAAGVFAGITALGLLFGLGVQGIFTVVVKNDQETFHEYWNGSEVEAFRVDTTCHRDGSCRNTFSCDPYTVLETEYYTDSEGNSKSRTVTKTKYHSCPYSQQETSYYVNTTVGEYDFGKHIMTGEQWRWGHNIPGGQVTSDPEGWTAAKKRIDSGNPGPVTRQNTYKNYILASDRSILKRYADSVDQLREADLLPSFDTKISHQYRSDKVYFAGVDELMSQDLKNTLLNNTEYLNAFTGSKLGADVRIVFVDASKIKNPYKYSNSIHTYWQSKEFKRDAIPKNAAVFVIGVKPYKAPEKPVVDDTEGKSDDTKVETEKLPEIKEGTLVAAWGDFFSGMPTGNEGLKQEFRSKIPNTPIDKNLIGIPKYVVSSGEYDLSNSGAIQDIMTGDNAFERESMSAEHENDNGSGFKYLSAVYFETGHYVAMWIINIILLVAAAFIGLSAAMRVDGY